MKSSCSNLLSFHLLTLLFFINSVSLHVVTFVIFVFICYLIVMCAADDVRILKLRINEILWRAKRWIDSRCLKWPLKRPRLCWSRTGDPSNTQCGAAITRLMRNIGGPREAKRRLVASVVNLKLLCAALVWTSALNNHAIQKKLFSAQRGVVVSIFSAYRTVSTSVVLVLVPHRLIPELATRLDRKHGQVGFYLKQALSGYGCFNASF